MMNRAKLRAVGSAVVVLAVASAALAALRPIGVTSWDAAAPEPAAVAPTEIRSDALLIRLSTDRQKLIGFSIPAGSWQAVAADARVDAAASFKTIVVATRVAASVSEGRAAAFGATAARWDVADAPAGASVILSEQVAVCAARDSNRVLAFSERVGRWDAVTLDAAMDEEPVVGRDFAQVHAGGKLYVFSAATGKWAEPMP